MVFLLRFQQTVAVERTHANRLYDVNDNSASRASAAEAGGDKMVGGANRWLTVGAVRAV